MSLSTSSSGSPTSSTFMAPVIAAINHLLAQESWARAALLRHAGKQACIDISGIALCMRVAPDGMLEAARADEGVAVTIGLKLADLPLIAQHRERAFSYVKIDGDAELANTISQLSQGLRWEAEHDLEKWIGPIAAVRLVGGAKSAFGAARASQQKLAENVAEFFLEEQPLLIRPAMVDDYASEVSRLRDDVERAAKRIARLEQALAPSGTTPTASTRGQQPLDL